MESQSCGVCGGDGQIANSFGSTTRCPGCHGTGRRTEPTGMRDVTKTKPSHQRTAKEVAAAKGPQVPTTFEGVKLANEVTANAALTDAVKAKIVREIVEHESSHGSCTQTFLKKVRKQVRP